MARNDMAGLFNVNRSVTSLAAESRQLRLPAMHSFSKLRQNFSRPVTMCVAAGVLPEMTTDVIDVAAGYAVENVKRDRSERRTGLREWLGRMLRVGS